MKPLWQLWGTAWMSGFLLLGCESSRSIGSLDAPQLQASPYQVIGRVTHMDPGSATVVVRLENNHPEIQEDVFSRDNRLNVTGRLKPTGIRTGRSVGMVILQGKPKIGEEVCSKITL